MNQQPPPQRKRPSLKLGEDYNNSSERIDSPSTLNEPSSPGLDTFTPLPHSEPNVPKFSFDQTASNHTAFDELDRIRASMENSGLNKIWIGDNNLSEVLKDHIKDLDPDSHLRHESKEGAELESPGFKVLTQYQIEAEQSLRTDEEKKFNIASKTIDTLRGIARSNGMAIITRPVNKTALTLMKQGAVGKSMFIHGKSASDDSLAEGLIPLNAGSSKAGQGDNASKIKVYNEENKESLERSRELFEVVQSKLQEVAPQRRSRLEAELVDLNKKTSFTAQEIKNKAKIEQELKEGPTPDKLLQEAKIPEEYFHQMVFAVPVLDTKKQQIYVFEEEGIVAKQTIKDKDGKDKKIQMHAIKTENGKFQFIDKNHKPIGEPRDAPEGFEPVALQVMGKPEITIGKDGTLNIGKVRPITADIDVLAYGAKLDLYEFDKMPSYAEVVAGEKRQLLEGSNFQLTQEARESLINHKIDDVVRTSGIIPDNLKQDKEFMKLAESFKNIELQRENLKGMGSAPDAIMAITGVMRAAFKDSVEISHASEQFNIGFTQPLDKEWVMIDPKGNVKAINGEKELLEAFSHFKNEKLSMPPNPNWGWELKKEGEGWKYEKNKDLVDISANCQQLCLKRNSLRDGDKQFVSNVLKLQTEVGMMAISEQRDDNKFAQKITELDNCIDECRLRKIFTKKDLDEVRTNKKQRENIYDPLQIQQTKQTNISNEKWAEPRSQSTDEVIPQKINPSSTLQRQNSAPAELAGNDSHAFANSIINALKNPSIIRRASVANTNLSQNLSNLQTKDNNSRRDKPNNGKNNGVGGRW